MPPKRRMEINDLRSGTSCDAVMIPYDYSDFCIVAVWALSGADMAIENCNTKSADPCSSHNFVIIL